jgi:hypothetical protein
VYSTLCISRSPAGLRATPRTASQGDYPTGYTLILKRLDIYGAALPAIPSTSIIIEPDWRKCRRLRFACKWYTAMMGIEERACFDPLIHMRSPSMKMASAKMRRDQVKLADRAVVPAWYGILHRAWLRSFERHKQGKPGWSKGHVGS